LEENLSERLEPLLSDLWSKHVGYSRERQGSPCTPPVQPLPLAGPLPQYPLSQPEAQKAREEATLNDKYYKLMWKLPVSIPVCVAYKTFKAMLLPPSHAQRWWVQASGEKMPELGAGATR